VNNISIVKLEQLIADNATYIDINTELNKL